MTLKLFIALILSAFTLGASSFAAEPTSKMNVLFIYAEDIGYYTGERGLREPNTHITGLNTPNLDKLAAESVNFTRAFCGPSVCSPSK